MKIDINEDKVLQVAEDTFHLSQRPLKDEQVASIQNLKITGAALYHMMGEFIQEGERSRRAQLVATARMDLERSLMMAVKAMTI